MKIAAATCLLLLACTPVPDLSPKATDMIAVSSGGMLGQSGTQIFGDDRVVTSSFNYGRAATPAQQTIPGAFARAAAVIRAEGRRIKAEVEPEVLLCMDYGTDLVQAVPPIAGFDNVAVSCPNDTVSKLMADVLGSLAS